MTAHMKKFGLIGHPISHSLSPSLFKAAFRGKYSYDLIEEENFEKAYETFLKEYAAINVTAPFKELAYSMADRQTEVCKAIGAANILIKNDDGSITADNSDHAGVLGAVKSGQKGRKGFRRTALIVGCGGAAKAAAYAMGKAGYITIITHRHLDKAREFADKISTSCGMKISARPMNEFRKWFRKAGVIIYTLPVSLPEIERLSADDIRGSILWCRKAKIMIEANYKDPAFTDDIIRKWTEINPDMTFVDGREWLLHQAVGASRGFTGEEPDLMQMRSVLF